MALKQLTTMTIIAYLAVFLGLFYIPAGFLAVIMGFAALDEIRRYKYQGKGAAILSIALGGGTIAMHLLLTYIYGTSIYKVLGIGK